MPISDNWQAERPGVFISYARSDGTETCERLATFLESVGYKALVDRRVIGPGDTWSDELIKFIYECHAALVVITPAAVKSPWVRKEVTNLFQRHDYSRLKGSDKSRVGAFPLIPIFDGERLDEATLPGWKEMAWQDLQGLQAIGSSDLAKLREHLDRSRILRSFVEAEIEAEHWLAHEMYRLNPQTLLRARTECIERRMLSDADPANDLWLVARQVAAAVLRSPPLAAVETVMPLINEMPQQLAERTRDLLLPNWVHPDAAADLRRIVALRTGRCVLQSKGEETARFHVDRAHRTHTCEWRYVPLANRDHQGENELEVLRRELRKGLVAELILESEDEIAAELASGRYAVLVFVSGIVAVETMAALSEEFPTIVFLLGLGETEQTDVLATLLDAKLLRPPLVEGVEREGLAQARRAKKHFDRHRKG